MATFFTRKPYMMDNSLHLPSTVNIYGANVDVVFDTEHQGTFSPTSISNKLVLKKLIID